MAETKVELNTGFTSGPAGLAKHSRLALSNTNPEAMPDSDNVTFNNSMKGAGDKEFDVSTFPAASLGVVFPGNEEYPNRGAKPLNDGKSLTA